MGAIPKNLIFLHIPKAGGTTLHNILRFKYPLRKQFRVNDAATDRQWQYFVQLPEEKRLSYRIVRGHMHFGLHEYMPSGTKYITMLRDPVSRAKSLFNYINIQPKHYLHDMVISGNLGLGDLVVQRMTTELDNGQVRILCGNALDVPFGALNETHLNRAKKNISKFFLVAGPSENFDAVLMMIADELGWKFPPLYHKRNAATGKGCAVSEEDLQCVRAQNVLDVELYQWVVDRFWDQIAVNDHFQKKLDRFCSMNNFFQNYIPSVKR